MMTNLQEIQKVVRPVSEREWEVVFKLVRAKKGKFMDEDAIRHYIHDYFELNDLKYVTPSEVGCLIGYLSNLPDA